jgi:cytochrome c-type biogenesis protein CcmH/NrfG
MLFIPWWPGPVTYPRSLLMLAGSLERLGRHDEAARTIERLLALWRRADPDLPLLAEAKALRKRLAAARAGPAKATPDATGKP